MKNFKVLEKQEAIVSNTLQECMEERNKKLALGYLKISPDFKVKKSDAKLRSNYELRITDKNYNALKKTLKFVCIELSDFLLTLYLQVLSDYSLDHNIILPVISDHNIIPVMIDFKRNINFRDQLYEVKQNKKIGNLYAVSIKNILAIKSVLSEQALNPLFCFNMKMSYFYELSKKFDFILSIHTDDNNMFAKLISANSISKRMNISILNSYYHIIRNFIEKYSDCNY